MESWGAHAHGPWNEEGCIEEDVDVYVAMSLPTLHQWSVRKEWWYGRAGSLVDKWEGWDWEKMGSTQLVEPTETCVVDLGPSQMTPLFLRCLGPFKYASMAVSFIVLPRLTFPIPRMPTIPTVAKILALLCLHGCSFVSNLQHTLHEEIVKTKREGRPTM